MSERARTIHVALLRGVNVSGKNRLPMHDLEKIFEDAGCQDVETYIQSGNVVFAATRAQAKRVPALVQQAIADSYGYAVPVVMRTSSELMQASKRNPFLREHVDAKSLHLAMLSDAPKRSAVAKLDPQRSPPDRYVVRGREIYLCCPKGLGRSKLTNAYFDGALDTTSTIRNWKTVLRLVEMSDR